MSDKFSHEELGFGDVQTDERPKTVAPATQTASPQPVAPPASTPLPTKAIAAVPVMPPSPRMPTAKTKTTAEDILPSLPEMPDVTKDPAFIKNAETAGAVGAGTVGLLTLLGLATAAATAHLAKKYAPPPAVPTEPELTINPNEIGATEAPKSTIQSRSFSPKEAAVAGNITDTYPFSLQEAKNGLGIGDVKITDPTQAKLVADQYAKQLQAQSEANTSVSTTTTETPPVTPVEEIKPVTPTETPKTPASTTETTPTGSTSPEEKKKGGRPSAKSMEGMTFRSDLGPGDNWLYNTAGPERRKAILAEFNEGKPAKDYKTAQEIYKKYQEKYPKDMFGPVIPVEKAVARGIKPPENYGALGKVAKVGGVAGLALTAAELANAAQQSSKGNNAPLRENIFNLLGMIPGLGTAFTAGTYSGGLNENQDAELARRRQMPPTITSR